MSTVCVKTHIYSNYEKWSVALTTCVKVIIAQAPHKESVYEMCLSTGTQNLTFSVKKSVYFWYNIGWFHRNRKPVNHVKVLYLSPETSLLGVCLAPSSFRLSRDCIFTPRDFPGALRVIYIYIYIISNRLPFNEISKNLNTGAIAFTFLHSIYRNHPWL